MYYDFNTNHPDIPQRAYEIELRARKLEKQYALLNFVNRHHDSQGSGNGLAKAARRFGAFLTSLFL